MTQPQLVARDGERPAVYLPDAQPMPYYARPDLAYIDITNNPAAPPGLVWQTSPPTGLIMLIQSGVLTITTSAVVASRQVVLLLYNETNAVIWRGPASATIPASTSATITFSPYNPTTYNVGTEFVIAMPPLLMFPGYKFQWNVLNWDAGDVQTTLRYNKLLIPTGPPIDAGLTQGQPSYATPLIA